jgi:hypothetical protein
VRKVVSEAPNPIIIRAVSIDAGENESIGFHSHLLKQIPADSFPLKKIELRPFLKSDFIGVQN